jgi:hypothetical protein
MSDGTLTVLLAILTALAGFTLVRLIGPSAGGLTIAALIGLFQTYRRRRRERRSRLIAAIRSEDPARRSLALQGIDDLQTRRDIEIAVEREGSVASNGDVERFPFPASFIRVMNRIFWFRWSCAAVLLGTAGTLPLGATWRVAAFALGLLAIYSVWRATHLERALHTVIEISPRQIAEIWPDDSRLQLHLGQNLSLQLDTDGESFWIIAASGQALYVSRHRLAFRRLADLCQRYARASLRHRETGT